MDPRLTGRSCGLLVVLVYALLAASACTGTIGDPPKPPGAAIEARSLTRMTAEEFRASLKVATGESWSRFNGFAAVLGKPDYLEITEEGRELSVAFSKLVEEAAREACHLAVNKDLGTSLYESRPFDQRIILHNVSDPDPFGPETLAAVKRLVLNFHGLYVTSDLDQRLTPWLGLLQTGIEPGSAPSWEQMKQRWKGVCVGLVTHPDFLTY